MIYTIYRNTVQNTSRHIREKVVMVSPRFTMFQYIIYIHIYQLYITCTCYSLSMFLFIVDTVVDTTFFPTFSNHVLALQCHSPIEVLDLRKPNQTIGRWIPKSSQPLLFCDVSWIVKLNSCVLKHVQMLEWESKKKNTIKLSILQFTSFWIVAAPSWFRVLLPRSSSSLTNLSMAFPDKLNMMDISNLWTRGKHQK